MSAMSSIKLGSQAEQERIVHSPLLPQSLLNRFVPLYEGGMPLHRPAGH